MEVLDSTRLTLPIIKCFEIPLLVKHEPDLLNINQKFFSSFLDPEFCKNRDHLHF